MATAAETAGAVVGRKLGQVREQNAGRREVTQHRFQLLADGELCKRASFHSEITDCPALPVNVLGLEVHRVALRCAGFPKQFKVKFPLGLFLLFQNAFMLGLRDAAPVFGFVFRPEIRGDNRNCNPAKMHGEVVKPFQKLVNGNLVLLEHGKEIVGGGFHQFLVSDAVKGRRLKHARVTLAAALLASALHLFHDNLPCALHESGVTGGQIGAGKVQV